MKPTRPAAWRLLRWRLLLLFVLFALGTTVVFLYGMQKAMHGGWQTYVRPLVADYLDGLAADIGTPPDVARAQALVDRLPLAIRIEGPQVNWDSDPERTARHALAREHGAGPAHAHRSWFGRPMDAWSPPMRSANVAASGSAAFDAADPPGHESGWWQERVLADGHRITFGLADPPTERRPRLIGWATLSLLLLLTLLAYAAVRHLLRPLDDIRAGADRFGRGEFDTPIPQRRPDELGALAGQINTMAGRLHGMLDAKRALLLAMSHELRSPLTRARLNAELVEDAPGSQARAALLHDLAEMRDLVTALLESERLSGGHAVLHAEPTDLRALVQDVLTTQFADRAVTFDAEDGIAPLMLDSLRIRLLVRNLVDNALRHSADAAQPPEVSLHRASGGGTPGVVLRVRDFGAGVTDEQLAHLAEPFYRADSARQRSTGGVGLGLYLCRLVAQAHGAVLDIRRAQPGLEVEVVLPQRAPTGAEAPAST